MRWDESLLCIVVSCCRSRFPCVPVLMMNPLDKAGHAHARGMEAYKSDKNYTEG